MEILLKVVTKYFSDNLDKISSDFNIRLKFIKDFESLYIKHYNFTIDFKDKLDILNIGGREYKYDNSKFQNDLLKLLSIYTLFKNEGQISAFEKPSKKSDSINTRMKPKKKRKTEKFKVPSFKLLEKPKKKRKIEEFKFKFPLLEKFTFSTLPPDLINNIFYFLNQKKNFLSFLILSTALRSSFEDINLESQIGKTPFDKTTWNVYSAKKLENLMELFKNILLVPKYYVKILMINLDELSENYQRNEIDKLDLIIKQCISLFPSIKKLTIKNWNFYNSTVDILGHFYNFEQLTKLYLVFNDINNIEGLGSCINLLYLDLSDNNIDNIEELGNLTKLEDLNLNNQFLNFLTDDKLSLKGLENLTNLIHLNVQNTKIDDNDVLLLEKLYNMTQLDLSHNPNITNIFCLSRLKKLNFLDLVKCKIEKFDVLGNFKLLSSLSLIWKFFDVNDDPIPGNHIISEIGNFKLYNLKWFYLNKCHITEIQVFNRYYMNLELLDLSNNRIVEIKGLKNLKNLRELKMISNLIVNITGLDEMINIPYIKQGQRLVNLRASFFNLVNLNLSYNYIVTLGRGLDKLVNLEQLNLTDNEIEEIGGLENLVNLKFLFLSKNNIKEIKGLENLENLFQLDLSVNGISKIKGLDNLENLVKLDLSGNDILVEKTDYNIENIGLENLINLEHLDLSENNIEKIKGLGNLTDLTNLNLNSNDIGNIEGLENLTNLYFLELNNNVLTDIEGLDNLTNLYYLGLMNNQIQDIGGLRVLGNFPNFGQLHLNDNDIGNIEVLETLTNLQVLGLDYNPIATLKSLENLTKLINLTLHIDHIRLITGSLIYIDIIKFVGVDYNSSKKYFDIIYKINEERKKINKKPIITIIHEEEEEGLVFRWGIGV